MSDTIEIKWPWTMLPLEVADEYIAFLQENICAGHPLHGKKVFPSCIKKDVNELIVQFDNDDDDTYAIVNFNQAQKYGQKKGPKTEILNSRNELKKRFETDHKNTRE